MSYSKTIKRRAEIIKTLEHCQTWINRRFFWEKYGVHKRTIDRDMVEIFKHDGRMVWQSGFVKINSLNT